MRKRFLLTRYLEQYLDLFRSFERLKMKGKESIRVGINGFGRKESYFF